MRRELVMVDGVPRVRTVLIPVDRPLQSQVNSLQQQVTQVAIAVDSSQMPPTSDNFVEAGAD